MFAAKSATAIRIRFGVLCNILLARSDLYSGRPKIVPGLNSTFWILDLYRVSRNFTELDTLCHTDLPSQLLTKFALYISTCI